MKSIRGKNESYYDLDAEDLFAPPVAVAIVVAVIVALIVGLYALEASGYNRSVPVHNERAATYNELSLEERQVIAGWTSDSSIDPETFTMSEWATKPQFILKAAHGDEYTNFIPLYVLGFLAIFSVVTFGRYLYQKDSDYYLCSLPYGKPYGWILFFCMFIGWPFMLISFICMRVQCSKLYQERRRKRQEARRQRRAANQQEQAEVKRLAEDELVEAAKQLTRSPFPERAHYAFVAYAMNGQPKAYQSRLRENERRLQNAKEQLREAGEGVSQAQREIGSLQAQRAQIEATYAQKTNRKSAEADWQAIKDARGVAAIVYNRRRKRLEVLIKVRVPYEGELYDFGDYRLYIDGGSSCVCKEVRSGLKLNHTSTMPQYHIHGNHFCFGGNLSTIEEYLKDGRYAEAITLVVECLHSVNDEETARRIPNCFRKVSVIEKAKRRILRGNRFRFWQRSERV